MFLGMATWTDRWAKVDWKLTDFEQFIATKKERLKFERGGEDIAIMLLKQYLGRIDSWAIRFSYTCHKLGAYCIYPAKSFVSNIGHDGSGTHSGSTKHYETHFVKDTKIDTLQLLEGIDDSFHLQMRQVFQKSILRKTINFYTLFRYLISLRVNKLWKGKILLSLAL